MRSAFTSMFVSALVAFAGLAFAAGAADAQSRSPYRNNPEIQRRCNAAVQKALPGSHSHKGVQRNRTALFKACVRNGGTIPGRRRA
jgi:hypothetical protein